MLAKRIVPCLDVKGGKVVKGTQFDHHRIVGDVLKLAQEYCQSGADELVFYDITASCEKRTVRWQWVKEVAAYLTVPFCVAGGIRTVGDAEGILHAGADKVSINSPALADPGLINALSSAFGRQCVVVGIDSLHEAGTYWACQYTGDRKKLQKTGRTTADWIKEVEERGAGEIVLNAMDQDGMQGGYDILQLKTMRRETTLPLIASGGAGTMEDFVHVFQEAEVDGALAASVFHMGTLTIPGLKQFLLDKHIAVRPT